MNRFFKVISACLVVFMAFQSLCFAQQAPTLRVTSPARGFQTASSNVIIEGIYIPGSDKDSVMINDSVVALPRSFRLAQPLLSLGKNTFNFKVFSNKTLVQDFNVDVVRLDVKPTIFLTEPKSDISDSNSVLFRGFVNNADTLTLNGDSLNIGPQGDFAYSILLAPNEYTNAKLVATSPGGLTQTLEKRLFFKSTAKAPEKKPDIMVRRVEPVKKVETTTPVVQKEITPPVQKEELLVSDVAVAPFIKSSAPKPYVSVTNPQKNSVLYTNQFTLEGNVKNTRELYVNNKFLKTSQSGKFKETYAISDPGSYLFNLYAVGFDNQVSTTSIRVTKADPDANINEDSQLPPDLQEALSKRVTLELSDADVKEVFRILSKKSGLNIVSDNSLNGSVNIYLKDSTIRNAIQFILDTQGLTYRVVDNTIVIASPQKLDLPTKVGTKILKLNNLKAKDAEAVLSQHLSKGESVQAVAQDNLLVITADSEKFNQLTAIARRLDAQKVPQVFLEVQIIESSSTALEQKGIAWPSTLALGVEANITNEKTVIQSNPSFRAVVRMLEEEGKAKVLASPSLKTLNEEEAEIFIGDKTPVVQNIVDTTGRISESVIFVDSGITLKVLPSINPQTKEIRLKIRPEVSLINGYKGPNNDKPVIKTRKVNTVVSVKDTETVVIGGLFNSNETDTKDQIPMLGNIPIIGNLFFTAGSKEKNQTELIISVTPRIVEPDDSSAKVIPLTDR